MYIHKLVYIFEYENEYLLKRDENDEGSQEIGNLFEDLVDEQNYYEKRPSMDSGLTESNEANDEQEEEIEEDIGKEESVEEENEDEEAEENDKEENPVGKNFKIFISFVNNLSDNV